MFPRQLIVSAMVAGLAVAAPAFASPIDGSYTANTLAANDDESTGAVPMGFTFNFFGTSYTQLFVNNNGNVSFGAALGSYTPSAFPLPAALQIPKTSTEADVLAVFAPFGEVESEIAAGGAS